MSSRHTVMLTLILLGLLGAPLVSCHGTPALAAAKLEILTASGATVPLKVEIARTEAEQERGYMQRTDIPDGTGMIFAYTADRRMYFWMKNTPSALSIAFIDSSGTIREIYDMVPFSLEVVASVRSLRYALEVPAGWFTRAAVAAGDRLTGESLTALNAK